MAAVVLIGLLSLTAGITGQLQSTPNTCDCSGKLANIPVCGTDGFTYINICILKEAQKTDPSLGRRCVGACPCNDTVADYCHHRAASPSYTAADFNGKKSPEQMVNMVGIEHAAFGEEHLQRCFFSNMQSGSDGAGGSGGLASSFGGRFGRRTTTKSPQPGNGGASGQTGNNNKNNDHPGSGSDDGGDKPSGQNGDDSDKPIQSFANKPHDHPGNPGGMFGGPDGPASGEAGGRPQNGRGQGGAEAEGNGQNWGKGQADAAKSGEMGSGHGESPSGTANSENSDPSSPAVSGGMPPHPGMGPFGGHHPGGQHPGGHHNFPGRPNKPGRGMKPGKRSALPSPTGAVCLTNGQTAVNMKQANCAVESSTDKNLGVRCLGRCEECAADPGCPTA